jgi:flagellar motor switch protein FliM
VSLSAALRKVANIGVNSSGPIKFGEFMNSLPLPSCLNILRVEPLRGSAVMVIESKLLYALVDSLFGGSDVPYTKIEGKDFTPIEMKIARRIVMAAIEDLEKAWAPVFPLKIHYSRTEINPQFVAVVPPSDVVISTAFDVELEKMSGSIKLVIPYSTLEPIKSKLSVGFQNEQLEVDHIWINRIKAQLMATNVSVNVTLGHAWLNLREFMDLERGDVIVLDHDADKALDISVEGIHKFRGVPGVVKGNKAIKIVETMGDY